MNLFFKTILLSIFIFNLSADDKNLHYFLKTDKVNIRVSNQAQKEIYVNTLDIERFDHETPLKLNKDNFDLIETAQIQNNLGFDISLTKDLTLSSTYNYNINELRIKEEISDIKLEQAYKKVLVALKYEMAKTTDMVNKGNKLDSDTYSIIFNNKPHDSSINKKIKLQVDWIKSSTNFKFSDAAFLKAGYRGGNLRLELNIRFARD